MVGPAIEADNERNKHKQNHNEEETRNPSAVRQLKSDPRTPSIEGVPQSKVKFTQLADRQQHGEHEHSQSNTRSNTATKDTHSEHTQAVTKIKANFNEPDSSSNGWWPKWEREE